MRFKDVLKKIGLDRAIARSRATDETPVYIGEKRIDDFL